MTTLALIEDGRSFVGASQLLCVISHLLPSALFAWVIDDTSSLHILFGNSLHLRSLCAQRRRKRGWLRDSDYRLRRCIFIVSSAYTARQYYTLLLLISHGSIEQISAVGTEDERSCETFSIYASCMSFLQSQY